MANFQPRPATPLGDTDFSLTTRGMVKDGGRNPALSVKIGTKAPALSGTFLAEGEKQFNQAFPGFIDALLFTNELEALTLYPGTVALSKTIVINRSLGMGKMVPSGTTIIATRREDGAVSLRVKSKNVRDAIFPFIFKDGMTVTTRIEDGTPPDPRDQYRIWALTIINMWREGLYLWKDRITTSGNEERRAAMSGSSSFGG